jgi:hypothetical protein
MVITVKKMSLGWGLGGLVVCLWALGQNGCSSNSAAPTGGDASATDALIGDDAAAQPLGVPVTSCAGCPVCGGVLTSATEGTSYCTQACSASMACPTGTGCVPNANSANLLDKQCLKTCTTDSDCTTPFICRSDLPAPGKFCFSKWPPVSGTTGTDAGDAAAVGDTGAAETGTPVDAGAPETGTPEAGQPEAAAPDGGDAGDGG